MEFEKFRWSVGSMLDRLSMVSDPEINDRIIAARKRLDAERLKILVVGEFSRGKSTFINAFIGKPVLPSKVNPTTATINVLQGGEPPEAIIEYQDEQQEVLSLPDERINHFLDNIVTTSNKNAQAIRVVRIRLPGRLEKLQADLVDTPGVNDLDQAREEITFRYLREADAAVMLLDAQQPLSESERIFLKQKIIGSDVHRIVYVINKIDEVLANEDVTQAERIKNYVIQRLHEYLGIQQPEVHLVSSKNALRARLHGNTDTTPYAFETFEDRLIQFAGEQAMITRLGDHLNRLKGLIDAQKTIFEEKLVCLSADISKIDKYLTAIDENRKTLLSRISQLDTRLEYSRKELAKRITDYCRSLIHQMKIDLTSKLQSCKSDVDVDNFRIYLSSALRDMTVKLEAFALEETTRVSNDIEVDFKLVLEAPKAVILSRGTLSIQSYAEKSLPNINQKSVETSEEFDLKNVAVSIGIGYIGGNLFGPIGIAAAVIGSYFIEKAKKEQREAELTRKAQEQMINALHESCNALVERTQGFGEEVAKRESAILAESLQERARNKEAMLLTTAESLKESKLRSKYEKDEIREEIIRKLNTLQLVFEEFKNFKEQTGHASNN